MPPAKNGPENADQGTSKVSSEGIGGTPPAPGLERVKLHPPASDWVGHKKPGPRPESSPSDIPDEYLTVDDNDDDIDTPDASRHLPRYPKDTGSTLGHGDHPDSSHAAHNRNLRDTRSYIGHGGGDRSRDASYSAAVAAHNRSLKAAGHTTGQNNTRGPRFGKGPNRQELPGAFHDREQGVEDNRQPGIGGYTLGGIASSIQAAVIPTLQQKIQQLKDELRGTQSQLSETRGHLDAYMRELKRTRGENRQMAHHINGLDHERQRLKKANQSYENELSIVRRELQDAKNLAEIRDKELVGLKAKEADQSNESELSTLRKELEDAKNLAAIRGRWLQGAEVFLTKTDALSVSEVVEKVTYLNEEIFQAAALMGETLFHKPHGISQEEMTCAQGVAQGMIGSKLTNILHEQSRKDVPEANPLIVQVVLQVFLVTHCSQLVQSWSSDTTCASHLAAIYSRVRDNEEQTVSGRWRALTRNHSRPTSDSWEVDLLRNLGQVLRATSWATPSVQQRDAFEQKLKPIFHAVKDLRDALGEKFTSADLEISVIMMEADQVFQPACMEDAYRDPDRRPAGKDAPQEVVIGTTGIGLKKATVKRSAKGDVLYENVLSPKVALESTILEALNPPPPRGGRKKNFIKQNEKEVLVPPPNQTTDPRTLRPSTSPSAADAYHSSQQSGQQRKAQNLGGNTQYRPKDDGGIAGALAMM